MFRAMSTMKVEGRDRMCRVGLVGVVRIRMYSYCN